MEDLSGRTALVTGAAAGIGWATAQRLAAAGARVVLADLDGERAAARAADLGPQHHGVRLDVADASACTAIFDSWPERFGPLDILVNNAGRTDTRGLALVEHDAASIDAILSVNLTGVLRISRLAARLMRDRGGVVVNLASGAAYRALPLRGAYSASKAAVVELTRALAVEAENAGVRFHAVSPGFVHTELVAKLIETGRLDPREAAAKIPIGRIGEPGEIAAAIAFLAGRQAQSLNGVVLDVDGGSQAFGGSRPPRVGTSDGREAESGVTVILGEKETGLPWSAEGPAEIVPEAGGAALEERLNALAKAHGTVRAVIDMGEETAKAVSSSDALQLLFERAKCAGRVLLRQGFGSYTAFVPSHAFGDAAESAAYRAGAGMLLRTFGCEWAADGVRANAVIGRDIGGAVSMCSFLASPAASFVTAAVVSLDVRA